MVDCFGLLLWWRQSKCQCSETLFSKITLKRWVRYRFSYAMRHNDSRRLWVIANDVLEMGKVIAEFKSSWTVLCYKIHFCVLLQPTCAGEVSVVIVIDKWYNLACSSKGNTMVKRKKVKNVPISLFLTDKMQLFPIIYKTFEYCSSKIVNGNMSRMYYIKVNFPT